MDILFAVAGIVMIIGTPAYLHAVIKLHGVIEAEHPDWVSRRGSLRLFYNGLPPTANPNVGMSVVAVALGRRWRSLQSESARKYALRIRLLLFSLVSVFIGVMVALFYRGL
jgi:hypothetical protein